MYYEIYSGDTLINTIVADEAFCKSYCEKNGYTYVLKEYPKPAPTPTTDERLTSLETALAQTDETAIELYEANEEQQAINSAQDDALIEIYEMIGA